MDDMSDMAMGSAPFSNETYAYIFYYIIAASIAASGMIAWSFTISTALRLRARKQSKTRPAASSWTYTIVSLFREASYSQIHIPYFGSFPATGNMMVCAVYITVLISCMLSRVWTDIPMLWEAIALRAGYLCVAQLSLLIALSTKKNLIAYVLHSSHERLNIFHRLIGICVLVTATIHMGFYLREWLFYDVWKSQWAEMGVSMLQWGFAAWGILIFILVTSISMIRSRFYETWVIVHVVSMLAFFAMVLMHLDAPYRPWAYVPLIIWGVDRVIRAACRVYLNIRLREASIFSHCLVDTLPGGVVRVTLPNTRMKRKPGQFAYLSVYQLGINSHPFTVVSKSDAPNIVFMMKTKLGLTRALHNKACDVLPSNKEVSLACSIEGPYGATHTPFQSFDTTIFIAGGIGATFTISVLQDLVNRPGCCRIIHFLWVVKSAKHAIWFSDIFEQSVQLAAQNGVQLSIALYITCDEEYTDAQQEKKKPCVNCKCREKTLMTDEIEIVDMTPEKSYSSSNASNIDIGEPKGCCCTRRVASSECYQTYSGRPDLRSLLRRSVQNAQGESGVAVCGPTTLSRDVRNTVVQISDERAVKKGTGAEAIYLHVESQSY